MVVIHFLWIQYVEAKNLKIWALNSYAQGFALMKAASMEYNWDLEYGKIA
ncbi:MAG TPA: hypothetical protein VIM70_05905 [Clostridium sp.]